MTPEARDLQEDGCEGEHPPKAFLGGFELDETLLVDGWQDYGPEAEVFIVGVLLSFSDCGATRARVCLAGCMYASGVPGRLPECDHNNY